MSHWAHATAPLPGLPDKSSRLNVTGSHLVEKCWKDVLNTTGVKVCCPNDATEPLGLCPEHEAWIREEPWLGEVTPPPETPSSATSPYSSAAAICRAFAMGATIPPCPSISGYRPLIVVNAA